MSDISVPENIYTMHIWAELHNGVIKQGSVI